MGRQQLCVDRQQVHVDRLGTTAKIDTRFTMGAVLTAAATSTLAILDVDQLRHRRLATSHLCEPCRPQHGSWGVTMIVVRLLALLISRARYG